MKMMYEAWSTDNQDLTVLTDTPISLLTSELFQMLPMRVAQMRMNFGMC